MLNFSNYSDFIAMEKLGLVMQSLAPGGFPPELDAVAQAHSKCIIYFNDETTNFTEFNSPWFESAHKLFSKLMKGWYSILNEITQHLSLVTALEEDDNEQKNRLKELTNKVRSRHVNDRNPQGVNKFWEEITSPKQFGGVINHILSERFSMSKLSIDTYRDSKHITYRNTFEHFFDRGNNEKDPKLEKQMNSFLKQPLEIIEKETGKFATFFYYVNDLQSKKFTEQDYQTLVDEYTNSKSLNHAAFRKNSIMAMFNSLDWNEFYGSQERISSFIDLLGKNSVISMTGIGGKGKTALAIEIVKQKIKSADYDYFPFITSKSTEQGHLDYSDLDMTKKDPNNKNIHPGEFADNYQNMIDILLEIDSSRTVHEKTRMKPKEKLDTVIELFNRERILCVIDNYEDIEDGEDEDQKKYYQEFINRITRLDKESSSNLIITSRAKGAGKVEEVPGLSIEEIKNLLIGRMSWLANRIEDADVQKIATTPEIVKRLVDIQLNNFQNKSKNEINLWTHPLFVLYVALRITLGENPTKLFEKITAGEDVEVENIADYVIRKTYETIDNDELKVFLEDFYSVHGKIFDKNDIEEWGRQNLGQIDDHDIRRFIDNLELNNFIKQVESIDKKRQYQMTGMLVKFFKPKKKPDIHEIGQADEKKKDFSKVVVEDEMWLNEFENYIHEPYLSNFPQNFAKKIADIASRDKSRGKKKGYNNILKCLELLNKIQENPIPYTISSGDCSKHIIDLMRAQNAYSDDVNIYVSNIILLYSVDYLSSDIANNTAINWFLELNESVENGMRSQMSDQSNVQHMLKLLLLILGENPYVMVNNASTEFLIAWHKWFRHCETNPFFKTLVRQNGDDYIETAIHIAITLLKREVNKRFVLENWVKANQHKITSTALKRQVFETIEKSEYNFEELKTLIFNNKELDNHSVAHLPITNVIEDAKTMTCYAMITIPREELGDCSIRVEGLLSDDVFDDNEMYKVEFTSTRLKHRLVCKIERSSAKIPITEQKEKYEDKDDSEIEKAKTTLRKFIQDVAKPEGFVDDLFNEVSEAISDSNVTDSSYKELRRKSSLSSKTAVEVIDDLFSDEFKIELNQGANKKRAYYTFSNTSSTTKLSSNKIIQNKKPIKEKLNETPPTKNVESIPFPKNSIFKIIFDRFYDRWIEGFAILIDGEEGLTDNKWNDQKFGFKPFLRELKKDEGWTSELNSKQINKLSECFKQVISSNLHGEGHFSLMNRSDYLREIKKYCTSKLLKDDPYFEPYIESVITDYFGST